ncbi:MAG: hypothetical protein AAB223_01900, partial [Pseudomonadota bacterium]
MTRWLCLPAFLLAALPFALVWGLAGRPVAIPEGAAGERPAPIIGPPYRAAGERPAPIIGPPYRAAGAIPCVSYAPFRGSQTPFDQALVVAPAEIEDDLRKLAAFGIRCVRTYSVDQGLERVPEIAARHGMTVLLGAWIGREDAKNRRQLETAVQLANAHPGTVRAVIVGNEVLLRRERTADDLARDLAWVRARTSVPLTYA